MFSETLIGPVRGRSGRTGGAGRGRRLTAVAALAALGGALAGCSSDSGRVPGRSLNTALKPVAEEVHDAVARVWPDASKIWPGVVLKDRRIILGDGRDARLVSVDGVTRLSPQKLAAAKITMPGTGSSFGYWAGHPTVVMNIADPSYDADAQADNVSLANALFKAATDELFHQQRQSGKAGQDGMALRGTEFPLAVTPRLYRAMLYNDLLAAYRNPDQRARRLAGAAYWNDRWHKEYAPEAGRAAVTDAREGAAGYFDAVATALAIGADRDDRNQMRRYVPLHELAQRLDMSRLSLDGEGTALGGVAGLLLDETRKGWKSQVAQGGRPPADLLLGGVRPVAEQPSAQLRSSIQDVLAKENTDLIPRLDPLVSAYHDTAHALLLVPMASADGDLNAGGYYVARNVPYPLLARVSGTFRLSSGTLRADDASVLSGAVDGRSYLIVPLGPHGKVSGNRVELSSGGLTGEFQVTPRSEHGRREFIAR